MAGGSRPEIVVVMATPKGNDETDAADGTTAGGPKRAGRSTPKKGAARPAASARRGKAPGAAKPEAAPKPGRPVGSVRLTDEIERTICSCIRGGMFDHVAADLAGISPRTLTEWVARGEGRSDRPSTPRLQAFAKAYRRAKAEARGSREIKVFEADPKHWLKYNAPSQPGLPGWTEPVPEVTDDPPPEAAPPGPEPTGVSLATPEQAAEVLDILQDVGIFDRFECLTEGCPCSCHEEEEEAEEEGETDG